MMETENKECEALENIDYPGNDFQRNRLPPTGKDDDDAVSPDDIDDDRSRLRDLSALETTIPLGEASLSTVDGASISAFTQFERSELDETPVAKEINFIFDDSVGDGNAETTTSTNPSYGSPGLNTPRLRHAADEVARRPIYDSTPTEFSAYMTRPFEDDDGHESGEAPSSMTGKNMGEVVAISDDDDNDDSLGENQTVDLTSSPTSVARSRGTSREGDEAEGEVSLIQLDGDETLDDAGALFPVEISYILQENGSFLAAAASEALIFAQDGPAECSRATSATATAHEGSDTVDSTLETAGTPTSSTSSTTPKTTSTTTAATCGGEVIDLCGEETVEEDAVVFVSESRGSREVTNQRLPPGTSGEFPVGCGDVVYLQEEDGDGRIIQLPSDAFIHGDDGTVTMILQDSADTPSRQSQVVEASERRQPTSSMYRPKTTATDSQAPSINYPVSEVFSAVGSVAVALPPPPPPPPPSLRESVPVPGEDVILADGAPMFHSGDTSVDVVAQEVVVRPREKKKKKSKNASSKLVQGIVEYDFPEDVVIPTEPTHTAVGYDGAASSAPSNPSRSEIQGEGVNVIEIGSGGVGNSVGGEDVNAGGCGPVFPCSTPGLIQDADTMRALCYDYIDHLITTNRGKIAIPRTHEFGDIGGWGFLHFNPEMPPSFEEYQRHVNPLPKREDFPSKGFTRFLSCRGYLLPRKWEHLLPESPEAKDLYHLGAMQICARRHCPDALFDPRDEPIHTPEIGVNDAYYSFLASTQQRRPPMEQSPLAIAYSQPPTREYGNDLSSHRLAGRHKLRKRLMLDAQEKRYYPNPGLLSTSVPDDGGEEMGGIQATTVNEGTVSNDMESPEPPRLASPSSPIGEPSILLAENNVSIHGQVFEMCDGHNVSLFDCDDPSGAGKRRAVEGIPFRHSASFVVPQSNAVALQKVGKSKVPLVPSIVRNLDRIICKVKAQRTEQVSTRRKGGEFGFLSLGLIRSPPPNSEKMITHRTAFEERENLARANFDRAKASKTHTAAAQVKVEADEVVVLDDEEDRPYEDGTGSPFRRLRIATPSPPRTKRAALRCATPPRDPYRIDKPTDPPARPSKSASSRARRSRHAMRLRSARRRQRQLESQPNSYRIYELFGSEEEEDEEEDDDDGVHDGDDDDGDYVGRKPWRKDNDDDILRKTRRARRRIIDGAMSEDSGMSDDDAAASRDAGEHNAPVTQNSEEDIRIEAMVRGISVGVSQEASEHRKEIEGEEDHQIVDETDLAPHDDRVSKVAAPAPPEKDSAELVVISDEEAEEAVSRAATIVVDIASCQSNEERRDSQEERPPSPASSVLTENLTTALAPLTGDSEDDVAMTAVAATGPSSPSLKNEEDDVVGLEEERHPLDASMDWFAPSPLSSDDSIRVLTIIDRDGSDEAAGDFTPRNAQVSAPMTNRKASKRSSSSSSEGAVVDAGSQSVPPLAGQQRRYSKRKMGSEPRAGKNLRSSRGVRTRNQDIGNDIDTLVRKPRLL